MFRTITISLGAALCFASLSANAQTGYGVKPGAPSTLPLMSVSLPAPDRRALCQQRYAA